MLMPSWMSFVGKNKTWQNMINSMSWSSCLKCAIWNDALFQEHAPLLILEVEEAGASDKELVSRVNSGASGEEFDIEDIEDEDEEATSMYDSD